MAQVTLVKFSIAGKKYEVNSLTDDLTMNSFTGDFTGNGSNIESLNADNITTGVLDKARLDSTMAGDGTSFLSGVLSFLPTPLGGITVDGTGARISHDGSLTIIGGELSVISSGGATLAFKTFSTSGQADIIANSAADTFTYIAGSGISLTTNALNRSLTINSDAYTASQGVQLVSNDFQLNFAAANTWNAKQTITGFLGSKLNIQADVSDTGVYLFEVTDASFNRLATIDEVGNLEAANIYTEELYATHSILDYTASGSINKGAPVFQVSGADNTVAQASATTDGASLVGISNETIATGNEVLIAISGRITIPTGRIDGGSLTRGNPVYLSDTVGNVTSTPPTNVHKLGVATSSTSMTVNIIS